MSTVRSAGVLRVLALAAFVVPVLVLAGTAGAGAAGPAPAVDVLTALRTDAAALAGVHDPAFAGLVLDRPRGVVRLYLTDLGRAPLVLRAAARYAGFTPGRVVVRPARFSRVALDRAAVAWIARPHPFPVAALVVPDDGSGLVVEAPGAAAPAATDSTLTAAVAGVPVRLVAGPDRVPKSWDDVKWHDSPPFIGGDVLTVSGRHMCTAGLPAVRIRDGRAVMVSAGHCFHPVGVAVYTAAGATWAFGNGLRGRYVGTVVARSTRWDASEIVGADTNGDESDTSRWYPLTGAGYSWTGDVVCHDGARSASKGHPTPCGITVTHDDVWFPIGGHWARGTEGVDVHGWGCVNGDSGATVFAVLPSGRREARGQISSGGLDGTADQARVDWVQAPDILRTFGLRLNPRT